MSYGIIKVFFYLSWAFSIFLIIRIGVFFAEFIKRNYFKSGKDTVIRYRSFKSKLFSISILLFCAVWCLRFCVGYYIAYNPVDDIISLKPHEELFNSLVHTLQTFSLDENYAKYIETGKEMIVSVFGAGSKWIGVYGVYASVLNTLVPIAGGAILFEVISEFSPRVRLHIAKWRFWTEKCYFSELNDNSLALAKSIVAFKKHKVCIVFTDAYTDDEEETGSERLSRAKAMGAICLKEDLTTIKLYGCSKKIFLIDRHENSNLQTLTALLENPDKKIKKSEIYVFSSDGKYSQLDEEVAFIVNRKLISLEREFLSSKEKNNMSSLSDYKRDNMPTVIPINGIKNMAMNLFSDVPLFEPIIGKKNDENGKQSLTITILGSGVIGTELFLNAYWFGQILNCNISINVVSKEKRNKDSNSKLKGDFEGRINYINPDILQTADPKSDILKQSKSGDYSDAYFTYDYIESDVMSDNFVFLMNCSKLLNTDYFIVALGSDEENFTVADRLRQIIGTHHMYHAEDKKTVISYAIYNSDLCRSLNQDCKHKYTVGSTTPDIFMYAFGCLEDVYSVKNVLFEGKADAAYEYGEKYDNHKKSTNYRKDNENRFKDIYTYQANLAKEFHRKYKIFSLGLQGLSVFNSDICNEERYKESEEEYLRFIICSKKSDVINGKTKIEWFHELAWLEHRRWCAYMRIKGFRNLDSEYGEDFRKYYDQLLTGHNKPDHKFVSLKLHPCLVECSKAGINAEFDDYGFENEETEFTHKVINDYLDELSWNRWEIDSQKEDFKRWDYPEYELKDYEMAKYKNKREH